MNTQPLEMIAPIDGPITETEPLVENGFSEDEIVSLLWLRQWYQNGGSDRMEVVRHLEFTRFLLKQGKIEV
jgi:hypothetical protein